MRNLRLSIVAALAVSILLFAAGAFAGPVVAQQFSSRWTASDLGPAPGPLSYYGGLAFLDANTIVYGDQSNGNFYSVGLTRGLDGHITGFTGSSFFALVGTGGYNAGGVPMDGGAGFAANGTMLFTQFGPNTIGQFKPGSTTPDKLIDLAALGVAGSVGGLAIVPSGFGGAGTLKIGSYETSTWYSATLTPDGQGTYDISNVSAGTYLGGGLEGMAFVSGSMPLFNGDSVLISKWDESKIMAYDVDANGDVIASSGRDFVYLEMPEGLAVDPTNGDILATTSGFGGDHIYLIADPLPPTAPVAVPEPGTLMLLGTGLLAASRFARRRNRA